MRFLMSFLVLTSCLVTPAFAASNASEYGKAFSFNHGAGFQKHQLGTTVVLEQVRDLKVTYDFAVSGGAINSKLILPRAISNGMGYDPAPALPKNAIVIGCYIDVLTTPVGASATIALSTGQGAGDLLGTTTATSVSGIYACVPTGTAATSIKLTADAFPYITIATAKLTAGKFNVHILYALSD